MYEIIQKIFVALKLSTRAMNINLLQFFASVRKWNKKAWKTSKCRQPCICLAGEPLGAAATLCSAPFAKHSARYSHVRSDETKLSFHHYFSGRWHRSASAHWINIHLPRHGTSFWVGKGSAPECAASCIFYILRSFFLSQTSNVYIFITVMYNKSNIFPRLHSINSNF